MSVTTHHAPLTATRRTALGLALVALSTLMYEVLLTRIFSVTMWYHFAFVAISVAMFGMTVGALVVYLQPAWFPRDRVKRQLAIGSALFPIVTLAQLPDPARASRSASTRRSSRSTPSSSPTR